MRKRTWSSIVIVLVVASFMLAVGTTHAARKDVLIAEQPWSSSIIECRIMKHVLETRLGIPATVKPIVQAMAWPALDKGQVDAIPDMWLPNQKPEIDKYVYERKTAELSVSYNASQGIFVPTWVSKQYGITDIQDLNQHTEMFDLTGDKKGDLWIGPSAWMVSNELRIKIRDYGLDYDPLALEQWPFLTILKEKMRKKEPIVFYYWSPEWIFAKYDLTKLKEPPYDPKKFVHVLGKPEESHIACDWAPGICHIAISKKLKDRLPRAYQFFKNWYIPFDEVSFLIAEIEDVPGNPKKDVAEVAKKWVADHAKIVNDWLKGI